MESQLLWRGNVHFSAKADSDHEVQIDGPPDIGGTNQGVRPMELMLMGIGGCSAVDVAHILSKSRQPITDCSVVLTATRAETDPKVFESIHMHYTISGNRVSPQRVARAIELSAEKYCSASILMKRAGVVVTHDFEILESENS